MPKRNRKLIHDEETRSRIQAAQIINRLMGHINGAVDLSATQVSAALGLLRKVLPDLAAVAHSGEITAHYVARIPEPAETAEEWQKQHAPTVQ